MKLTVLVDNNTTIENFLHAEPGLSYLIEEGDKKILFDTGYTNAFIQNADYLNKSLLDINFLVLSHGHLDHTWGLDSLIKLYRFSTIKKINHNKPIFIAHPLAFERKINKNSGLPTGITVPQEQLSFFFEIKLSKIPVWLTEKIVYLGEIERNNNFEAQTPYGKKLTLEGIEDDDYMLDDSAIVYKSHKGLVILSGCSHSGICNIIEYAKKVTKEEKILDIVGGLHLLNPEEKQIKETAKYLANICPEEIHACHCTDLESKIAISKVAHLKEVSTGSEFNYE